MYVKSPSCRLFSGLNNVTELLPYLSSASYRVCIISGSAMELCAGLQTSKVKHKGPKSQEWQWLALSNTGTWTIENNSLAGLGKVYILVSY